MAAKVREQLEYEDRTLDSTIGTLPPAGVRQLKKFYKRASRETRFFGESPLTYASQLGLADIVWAFIECAKQTKTNLETGKMGLETEFLLHTNWPRNQTALDVAIANNHVNVVKVILAYVPLTWLISYRNDKAETLLSLLCNPQYDEIIFETMEDATSAKGSTLISVDDHQRQPQLQESILYTESTMDPISYPVSHRNPKKSLDKLDNGELELTPNKNTILHLVSQFGDIYYVEDILEKHPSLIYRRNCDGETPAYVAAREGHVDVLKIMINHFKKSNSVDLDSLLTRSIDNHTALHIAIQNHHAGVVFWLTKEIPQLANRINDHNESPLYHASERRYHAILKLLLRKCTNISFEGPNGKTALHAAAISGSPECIESLLSAKADLLYNQDKNGWTPLRYAIDHNNSSATAVLLDKDCSIGYDTMRKDGIITSPIHIAASQGHYQTMEVLISKCPGCLEITHSKGRNILHFAIENKKTKVIEFIFRDKSLTSLINKKDSDGNTPIHLLMASDLEMMEITMDSRVDVNILNHEGRTPLDMIPSEKKRKKFLQGIAVNASLQGSSRNKSPDLDEKQLEAIQEQEKMYERQVEKYFKMKDNLVLVVALIATATFAAGFTVPGGFDSNVGSKQEGMPILLGKPAFQAFVVFNAIAFACSCCVLFGHFRLQIYLDDEQNDMEKVENIRTQLVVMFLLTALAMITMAMAFAIGVYVVVTPFLGLAIYLSMISVFIMSFKSIFPVDFLNSIALLGTQIFRFI